MEYTISNDNVSFSVSSRGAEPISIKSADGTEYLWQPDPDFFGAHAPHIFPFIGRLFNESYIYAGVQYPMKIHGFLMQRELVIDSHENDSITLRLDYDEDTLLRYPFKFRLFAGYSLEKFTVNITFRVENLDDKAMYFGIGGHPGFNVPLEDGLYFEDYRLEFSAPASPKRILCSESLLLSGESSEFPLREKKILDLHHDIFDEDAIILTDIAPSVTLKSDRGSRSVTVSYPDCEYLGIWHTPKKEPAFVCIEPWTSLQGKDGKIEVMETSETMIRLDEGETYENNWSITIE